MGTVDSVDYSECRYLVKMRDAHVKCAHCINWESQNTYNADFYSSLVELLGGGWVYALKLELLCPCDVMVIG